MVPPNSTVRAKWPYVLPVSLAVFIVDRLAKHIFYDKLTQNQPIPVIPNIFHLTLVRNRGAAFGLFSGWNLFFSAFSILAIIAIILFICSRASYSRIMLIALALILGGALGNLFDRVLFGYVIDFLDFRIWTVFNIADSCITVGFELLAYQVLARKQ